MLYILCCATSYISAQEGNDFFFDGGLYFGIATAESIEDANKAISEEYGISEKVFDSENVAFVIENSSGQKYQGDIVIPPTVSRNGVTYYVEGIGKAFRESNITSVILPSTLRIIGEDAFKDCKNIKEVILPNSLIILIGEAFCRCSGLERVTLPSSLRVLGEGAFYGCTSLTTIVSEIEKPFAIDNSVFQAKNGNPLSAKLIVPFGTGELYRNTAGWNQLNIEEKTPQEGQTFTAETIEGYELCFQVISASDKTCRVIYDNESKTIQGHVTIPEVAKGLTVVEIGHEAFQLCDGLTGITIPNTVKKIDTEAFYHCTNLLSIDIPNSVKTIRHGAFKSCSSLANVTIGSGLNTLEEDVFEKCPSLSDITVNSENPIFDSRNICNAIIETATNKLILGCKSTIIPNDIKTIGSAAFAYNTGLTSISIPNSVTQIEANAFYCCTGLTNIKIPSSVIRIGGGFTWDDDEDAARRYESTEDKKERRLPRKSNWREDLTINAFAGCRNLVSISVEEGNPVFDSRDNCNAIIEKATNTLVTACTKTVIPSSVTSIGYGAYGYMDYLTTIDIPQTITSIKQGAFEGCNKLKKIVIPNGVKEIEDYTFEGCSSLTDVSIPNSVVNIGKSAFESCKSLTKVIIPNSVVKLGDYVFLFCSLLEEVSLPNSMKTIGDYAFNGCKALAHVYSEIEKPFAIGENVFPCEIRWESDNNGNYYSYVNKTTVLHVPYGTTADYKATDGWKIFENIVEPKDGDVFTENTIEGVDMRFVIISAKDKTCKVSSGSSKAAIANSTKGIVTIPEIAKGYKVISIDGNAFLACTNMTSVFIPNSVESIGASAFNSCVAIDSISIPASVTTIGASAFGNCSGLKSVRVEYEEPFAIGDDVFPYNQATLYVPVGTKKRYKATDGWKNFKAIESGALEEGDVFSAETVEGIVMTFMVTSETEKTCQVGTDDGNKAIANCRGKVTIPIMAKGYNVTYIAANAFQGCELDSINIPNTVTGIGYEAFYGCINLKSLVIPNGLVNIGARSFFGCSDLASITIPNSVKSIGQYAFGNCIGLYSVTSLITVPYKLDESVFQCTGDYDADIMYSIVKLFVPIGRSATYAATTGWKKFMSIADTDTRFKLTYMVDGTVYKSYDIQAAEVITPEPDPVKEGYIFSGWSDIPYLMPAQDVTVTGSFTIDPEYQVSIDTIKKENAVPEAYYSPEGRRLDAPQRGINIIKMSNGTTKKVVVK